MLTSKNALRISCHEKKVVEVYRIGINSLNIYEMKVLLKPTPKGGDQEKKDSPDFLSQTSPERGDHA